MNHWKEHFLCEILVMAQKQRLRVKKVTSCLILSPAWVLAPLHNLSRTLVTEQYSVSNCVLGPLIPITTIVCVFFYYMTVGRFNALASLSLWFPYSFLSEGEGWCIRNAAQTPLCPWECALLMNVHPSRLPLWKRLWDMLTQHILR